MQVKHVVLKKGQCSGCGRWVKAKLPHEYQTGYGPRFSALVSELSGIQGISRKAVEDFIQNVFAVPISTGGIQKVIDRVSAALAPVHAAIGASVRRAAVNHVDETSWQQAGAIKWLWTMTNGLAAFFMVHSQRSRKAFEALIENWRGILVSDNYGVCRNWVNRLGAHMASKHLYTDGKEIKTIDPWHSDGPMWTYAGGGTGKEAPDDELYARVAAVYRAINFTADTLSNMPFAIVKDASGDEVDTSEVYKNVVGFLPYPRQLLRLMVQSFIITNKAYAFQETKGRTVTNLRYIAPSTIQITTDPATGAITKFTRTLGTQRTDYPVDRNGFSNIVYCFNLNWKNELLPDDQSPFKAMCNAADWPPPQQYPTTPTLPFT